MTHRQQRREARRGNLLWVLLLAMYGVSTSVSLAVADRLHQWLEGRWHERWWLVPAGLFGALTAAGSVLALILKQRRDRERAAARQRAHGRLIAAASRMGDITDLSRLCRLIVHVVNRLLGLENSALALFERAQGRYALAAARYPSLFPPELTVESSDPLIEAIHQERGPLLVEALKQRLDSLEGKDERAPCLRRAYLWMRSLEAELIVPSFSNGRCLGLLVLGHRRNGEGYCADDLAVFSGLSTQAAMAIEQARFMEELKRREASVIHSAKLASLGQLVVGMAHELNNPLTIISGEAQLSLERSTGNDQAAAQHLRSIIEECHRAAEITRRILRFAKTQPAQRGPVDVRALVDESLQLAAYQAHIERIERRVEIPSDLPKAWGNQGLLQEALLSLIVNACRSMDEQGGRLEVRGRLVAGEVELRISDTGPGIPPRVLPSLFEPFSDAAHAGAGLSLFASRRIIHAHHGSIEARAGEGGGTTVTIRLPVARRSGSPRVSHQAALVEPKADQV